MPYSKKIFLIIAVFCAVFLVSCGKAVPELPPEPTPVPTPTPVLFPDGREIEQNTTLLDLSVLAHDQVAQTAECMKQLPYLSAVKLGDASGEDFAVLYAARSDAEWAYSFPFRGEQVSIGAKWIDLTNLTQAEAVQLLNVLPAMKNLERVTLGSEEENPVAWPVLTAVTQAAPWAAYDYSFSIYGVRCNLMDEKLDLWKVTVEDDAAEVYKVLPTMTKCTYVDMDQSIPRGDGSHDREINETMARLRDAFPDKTVVWRVYFSWAYSVRTDTEKILCSLTADLYGDNGLTDEASVEPLKYCTKVKYLDLGHNNKMDTISFTAYMPDLEVFIFYKDKVTDLSPLANCKKLRYLEICRNPIQDISVLGGLTELTDLNMSDCPDVKDMSCLFGLEKLQRLWIGNITDVPQEQIEQFQALHPNCIVNTEDNEVDNTWRYYTIDYTAGAVYWPRYQEIRSIFNYGENAQGQSMGQFDPYFTGVRDY